MKQTILVTGGTGFIGSHTSVELIEAGYEVVIVDDLSNSKIEVLDGIEKITGVRPAFEQVDLRDREATENVFRKYPKIEGIIHFAASKAVGESVQLPLMYYRNNIVSLLNLLELMPKYNVKGIIFSSSCTVYGQPKPENLPVTEDAPHQKATSPYGNTKEINEQIILDYINSGADIKSIVLRYFNPIGAHPSALIGELPNGVPNNLIPFVTQTAMGIRKELTISVMIIIHLMVLVSVTTSMLLIWQRLTLQLWHAYLTRIQRRLSTSTLVQVVVTLQRRLLKPLKKLLVLR